MASSDVRERALKSAAAVARAAASTDDGGRQAYLDLIAPGETPEAQLELGALPGSGLVLAAVFRAVGVETDRLDPPYVLGTAVSRLVDIAMDASAWVPFSEGQLPAPGDVVVLGGARGAAPHAYLVTAIQADAEGTRLDTLEDGGGGGDPSPVAAHERTWSGGLDTRRSAAPHEAVARPIAGWIDVTRLPLAARALAAAHDVVVPFVDGDTERLPSDVTKVDAPQMIEALSKAWTEVFGTEPLRDSILVLIAQWAIETGWGKAMHAYNIGNIKSVPTDGEDYTYFACDEYIAGQHRWFYPDNAACRFRAYKTLELGAIDYLKTVSHRFATSWSAVIQGDPASYAHLLKQQLYYTGSEADYTSGLVSIVNQLKRTAAAPSGGGSAAPPPQGSDLGTTLGVQQALVKLGYDPGGTDGKTGPRTRAAIQAFQRSAGLDDDGIVGPATRNALAAALAHLGSAPAAQAAQAAD